MVRDARDVCEARVRRAGREEQRGDEPQRGWRTLGARTSTLRAGLLAEYALLGLMAGGVASSAAQLVAWALAVRVFELPFAFSPGLWLVGLTAGLGLVTLLGYGSMRGVLHTPPRAVLS